jgi:hypothetical protein
MFTYKHTHLSLRRIEMAEMCFHRVAIGYRMMDSSCIEDKNGE